MLSYNFENVEMSILIMISLCFFAIFKTQYISYCDKMSQKSNADKFKKIVYPTFDCIHVLFHMG